MRCTNPRFVAGLMGLDNFDFASAAYDRWLRHNGPTPRAATARVNAAASDASAGPVLVLDTVNNKQLLQRLLNAG